VLPALGARNATGLRIAPPSLEELFLRHYGDDVADEDAALATSGAGSSRRSRRGA
jgi:ABC-2 type transport system ATP-binding protein